MRLRRVINKEMEEEALLNTARTIYKTGWNLIKLYFMTGLPTETEEDVKEIIHLSRRVLQQGKGCGRPPRLNVSVSTFVPKPHTPFQWERQLTLEETLERQSMLRRGLDRGRIKFKWHDPNMSLLEGVFSRGDRRLSRVLYDAFKMGCRFDGWSESVQTETWRHAFEKNLVDMTTYLRARTFSEVLPWNHIHCGPSRAFLRQEWEHSRQEMETPPCRPGCTLCGVCSRGGMRVVSWERREESQHPATPRGSSRGQPIRLLMEFQKVGTARFLGHLDMARAFHRAARRTGVTLRYSQGFHPSPRIRFSRALALGIESLSEWMEWELDSRVDEAEMMTRLNEELPRGLRVARILPPSKDLFSPCQKTRSEYYLMALPGESNKWLEPRIQEFLASDRWVVSKNGHEGQTDIRPLVERFGLAQPSRIEDRVRGLWCDVVGEGYSLLELVFREGEVGGIRVDRAIGAVLSLSEQRRKEMRILKLGQVKCYGR
jgi:radical SAM-linked protein